MASFYDKISNFNLDPVDPLFGGLIPRREVFAQPQEEIIQRRRTRMGPQSDLTINPPVPRQRGIDTVAAAAVKKPMDVNPPRYLDEPRNLLKMQIDFDRERLGLERQKFGHERTKSFQDIELRRGTQDIARKRLALDEWKASNPEGEIKLGADGNYYVISQQTGKHINTGLKSGELSEEQKIEMGLKKEKTMEGIRQTNRLALERERQTGMASRDNPQIISPQSQRVAEQDAADELLRTEYADLAEGNYVKFGNEGVLETNRPSSAGNFFGFGAKDPETVKSINARINKFEADLKARANERLTRTLQPTAPTRGKPFVETGGDMVDMLTPDGRPMRVPPAKVAELESKGAKRAK